MTGSIIINKKLESDKIRGRNGFDGDVKAHRCMPSFYLLVKPIELKYNRRRL